MTEYYDQRDSRDAYIARLRKDWPWAEKSFAGGGFVGAGWHQIIYSLLTALEGACTPEELATIDVRDIKEKWGALSIYSSSGTGDRDKDDLIESMITVAERASHGVCDVCGETGTHRRDGWHRTRCDKHEK